MFRVFLQSMGKLTVFMICAQMLLYFRPKEVYEKYLRLLADLLILLQVLLPLKNLFGAGMSQGLSEQYRQFQTRLEEYLEGAAWQEYESWRQELEERLPEAISEEISEKDSEEISEEISERISEEISEEIPREISERISEEMQGEAQEAAEPETKELVERIGIPEIRLDGKGDSRDEQREDEADAEKND